MPATVSTSLTNYTNTFSNCYSLTTITMPTTQTSAVTSIAAMVQNSGALTAIVNADKIGSLTATPLVDGNSFVSSTNQLASVSFSCPFTRLILAGGASTSNFSLLNSVRLTNTSAGQWTAAGTQINVSWTSLSTAALVTLFNDIAAQGNVVGKTINITSATGAAGLTAANRLIITSKGWTIIG
jgi:hypothetical protein